MKFWVALTLILTPISLFAQEVITCDGTQGTSICQSSMGVSTFVQIPTGVGVSVPNRTTSAAQKISIPKSGGIDLNLKTLAGSTSSNFWVSISNDLAVDFKADLSSKIQTDNVLEIPGDASSIVLTAGLLNSVTLNLSGYNGKSSTSFSYICAKDIARGRFGEEALNNFIVRRQNNPNLPTDQCDSTDIKWIEQNTHDSFCPAGTKDIRVDDTPNPSFNLTRLAPKNKCKIQKDTRQCLVKGNRYNCQLTAKYHRLGEWHPGVINLPLRFLFSLPIVVPDYPVPDIFANGFHATGDPSAKDNITRVTSSKFSQPGSLKVVSDTMTKSGQPGWDCYPFGYTQGSILGASFKFCIGVEGYPDWREVWNHTVVTEYSSSTFYISSDKSAATAISEQCEPFIDKTNDLQLFTSHGEVLGMDSMNFSLPSAISIHEEPKTTSLLCSSYVRENFPERNVLEITTEPSLNPERQYEYAEGACPEGSTVESVDQNHFNSNWLETYACTKDNCPNTSLFYSRTPKYEETTYLLPGQQGGDRGRAAIFAYDVNLVNVQSGTGSNGESGSINIQVPTTVKYCVDIKDYSNTSDIHNVQSQTPSVTINQIDYSLYDITLPDALPSHIYDTTSKPYVYKKLDSSVRDWVIRLTDN